jgi:hypothetical protein
MNTKTLLIIATAIIALFIVVSTLQYTEIQKFKQMIEQQDTVYKTKTDTLWKDTTITEKELVPKYIVKTKTDTVYTSNGDTLQLVTESKMYDKRLTTDKDTADIQIYTTGINTSLDSLKWRLKTHTEIVTNNIEIVRYKKKLITTSPSVSVGYDPINKQWGAMLGVSLNLNIW